MLESLYFFFRLGSYTLGESFILSEGIEYRLRFVEGFVCVVWIL